MNLIKYWFEDFETLWGWERCAVHLVEDNGVMRKFRSINLWEQPDSNPIPHNVSYYNNKYWTEIYDQETHYKTHQEAYNALVSSMNVSEEFELVRHRARWVD